MLTSDCRRDGLVRKDIGEFAISSCNFAPQVVSYRTLITFMPPFGCKEIGESFKTAIDFMRISAPFLVRMLAASVVLAAPLALSAQEEANAEEKPKAKVLSNLVDRSPFLPANVPSARPEAPRAGNQNTDYEFRGVYSLNGTHKFLVSERAGQNGRWVRLNDASSDYVVKDYDESSKSILLSAGGQEKRIALMELASSFTPIPVSGQPKIETASVNSADALNRSSRFSDNRVRRVSDVVRNLPTPPRRRIPPPPPQAFNRNLSGGAGGGGSGSYAVGTAGDATTNRLPPSSGPSSAPPNFVPAPPPNIMPPSFPDMNSMQVPPPNAP